MMRSFNLHKLAAFFLAFIMIASIFAGCSINGKDPAPEGTSAPQSSDGTSADASTEPSGSEDATAYPDQSDAASSLEPGSTQQPDIYEPSADPAGSEQPGTTSSAATPAPGQTSSPVQTGSPSAPTAQPTAHNATQAPVQTAAPTAVPTATPKPDPVTAMTKLEIDKPIYCDMDFDGTAETIELTSKKRAGSEQLLTLKVTVGSSAIVLVDSFVTETYLEGFINNFNSGDKRVEIVLSVREGKRNDTIKCYRLNPTSSGLLNCSASGHIISVGGNGIMVGRYVDLMGTWECTSMHVFSYNNFSIASADGEWYVTNEPGRYCTVSDMMFVGFYTSGSDNEFGYLYGGIDASRITPTATDLSSRIDFVTDNNVRGFIEVTFGSDGLPRYEGKTMDHWFSDLTFIK